MLNDLYELERGLAAYGETVPSKHPDIKDMAKGRAILVRLDADGAIDGLEAVEEAGNGALWTLRDGQHNGFPGLKTGQPGNLKSGKPGKGLLAVTDAARAAHEQNWAADKTAAGRRRETLRLMADTPFDAKGADGWPNAGHRKRIAERLEQLAPLSANPDAASVPAAFERFLRALAREPSFLADLTERLKERLQNGDDAWIELARDALIGPAAISIDVRESDFPRDVRDARQVAAVSAALSAAGATSQGACALSGNPVRLHEGNFPQPNLPGVGQTYLFSRNSDIPSLTRYGRTSDKSFAIGADLLGRLSGAVLRLTEAERRDKTWRLIPAESGDKPDLMIAFCAAEPETAFATAVHADDDEDEAPDIAEFEARTGAVLDQSLGKTEQVNPQSAVRLLIVRAVDPANRKAIYHRAVSVNAFFDATRAWRLEAMENAPAWIAFMAPATRKAKGAAIVVRHPPRVSPLSLTPLSRRLFVDGGRRSIDARGIPASEAFALFLRDGDVARRARGALRLLLDRHGPLLSGLAQAARKGAEALRSFDPKFDLRWDALRSVSWFGALLSRLGRDREVYMSGVAFRLGQLLAALDVVHVGYCADLRGGDVPPTLLGNSVLSIAGSHPKRALAIVQGRWKPYAGWAKQERDVQLKATALIEGKDKDATNIRRGWDMRHALSHMRRIRPTLAELAADLLHAPPCDDTFKAELLLGYMAGLPAEDKDDPDARRAEGRSNGKQGEDK